MRRFGRITPVAAAVLAIASVGLLAMGTVQCWAVSKCKQPDTNTSACYNTPDGIGNCTDLSPQGQTVCQSKRQYTDIQQFPQSWIATTSGTVHQPMRDCYKFKACSWHAETKLCLVYATESAYTPLPKWENNPDVGCTEE
jgi:hypothetical protein